MELSHRKEHILKRLFLLLALLAGLPAFAQNGTTALLQNPTAGSINAQTTNCSVANACVWMKLPPNAGTAAITLSGTFSGTFLVEVSSDSVNFVSVGSFTAPFTAGQFPISGMTDIRVRCSTYSSGTANVSIQGSTAGGTVAIPNIPTLTDPCQNPSLAKSSVAINIASATTTQLVAPSGTTGVYVCGFSFTISQVVTTANTLQFTTGSGATCGTNTVTKSGTYGAGGVTAAAPIVVASPAVFGTVFSAAPSSGVCAVTAIGASGSFQGMLTFVQL